MSDDLSRQRLGRGLAALIGDMDRPAKPEAPAAPVDRRVPIEHLAPNPRNPRRSFAEADLEELAASLKTHGIVQPIVVRPATDGAHKYEIIAGERRWRAAQRARLPDVPVIVREVDDRTALELAIVENVQRADLNPLDEALGYQQLVDDYAYAQTDLAQIIGKSRSHVANTLRLLKLPDPIRAMLVDGSLTAGHARALVTAPDPVGLARRIVDGGLSVRQAEALAQAAPERPRSGRKSAEAKDADTKALETMLGDALGMQVTITHRDKGGELRIAYKTLEQLDAICQRLRD